MHTLPSLGWRELVTLPDLGLRAIKSKIDTGARTSALHVAWLEEFHRDDRQWLRFAIDNRRRNKSPTICEALAFDRRAVTDSGGHITQRWFIRSAVSVANLQFDAEINLTDRGTMLFPLLLGRSALRGRFVVDPHLSYVHGRLRIRVAPGGSA
jgi:hypothetical protein